MGRYRARRPVLQEPWCAWYHSAVPPRAATCKALQSLARLLTGAPNNGGAHRHFGWHAPAAVGPSSSMQARGQAPAT